MPNFKNPTALLMQRMAAAGKGAGSMAALMQKYFADNYGKTDLPKRVADFIIFDQIKTGTATSAQFFQGTWASTRTNFPGGSFNMPQSEHAIITGIRVLDAITTGNVETSQWRYGVYDAPYLNGELQVTSNGETVLTQLPLTAFQSAVSSNITAAAAPGAPSVSGETDNDAGFFYLMEPIVLLGQTDIKTNLLLKAAGTANSCLRIELHGIRFIGG
jgi:hypothetical protein